MFKSVDFIGYKVYSGSLDQLTLLNDYKIINTINAYSYVVAKNDDEFKKALQQSHILLPDGFPIVSAVRILSNQRIKKIAGEDIFLHLMSVIDKRFGKVFFLGSNDQTLQLMMNRVSIEYPNIRVNAYSPPFRDRFSLADTGLMLSAINGFAPDVLFVGMTAPKQEKWVAANHQQIDSKIICSIGAVFGFYAGTYSRPSKFWIYLKLEWFVRFIKEPRRLWKRYFYYSPQFFIDVLKQKCCK
jgi:N-acetylglucosaminyldiphosphoundecaprenol N-acetyl-beta-D-mannosaminyltransferase